LWYHKDKGNWENGIIWVQAKIKHRGILISSFKNINFKMKKLILIPIFLSMFLWTNAQKLIISDSIYKIGIYKDFQEFKYNNPSIEFNYKITTKNRRYGFLLLGGKVTFYKIVIDRKKGKSIGEVFGFCDGKNIYINPNYVLLKSRTCFSKIEYLGQYSYFEDISTKRTFRAPTYMATPTGGSFVGGGGGITYHLRRNVIDLGSATVSILDKKFLRLFIANDNELLNEFNNESNKNKKIKEYFIKYFEKMKKLNKE